MSSRSDGDARIGGLPRLFAICPDTSSSVGTRSLGTHVEIGVAALRNRLEDEGLQQASRFWDARIAQAAVNYDHSGNTG